MGPLASAKGEEDARDLAHWQYKSVVYCLSKPLVAGIIPLMAKATFDELQERKYAAHPIVRQIIDRDCHVAISTRAVVEHVISKLRNGYETFISMPPADRHRFLRQCIDIHQANRVEYQDVMNPRYGQTGQ